MALYEHSGTMRDILVHLAPGKIFYFSTRCAVFANTTPRQISAYSFHDVSQLSKKILEATQHPADHVTR